ncbi:MAG: thrombospondin type 3 repeat-containing protein, partial [Planctomycetota bacterium]
LWRSALSAADIAANYDQPLNVDDWPALAGYWRFDEADTALSHDSSASHAHGRLGRGVRWRYPQRVDAAVYADYPRSLIQVACGDNDCPLDFDNDGVSDYVDNCLAQTNPDQRDADLDGYGNRCDGDFNNDDIVNTVDLGYLRSVFFTENLVADINGDGVVNVVDLGLLRQMFFAPPGPAAE